MGVGSWERIFQAEKIACVQSLYESLVCLRKSKKPREDEVAWVRGKWQRIRSEEQVKVNYMDFPDHGKEFGFHSRFTEDCEQE